MSSAHPEGRRPAPASTRVALLAALFFAALVLGACQKEPAAGDAQPTATAASSAGERGPLLLRVLTFNAFVVPFRGDHEASRDRIGPAIGALGADLVALQEVWTLEDAELLARSLGEQGLSHQRWLASDAVLAYGSPGLLVASRYPLGPARYHPFQSGTLPRTAWHPDWFSGKGVVAVEVQTPLGPIDFVNTHLQAAYTTYDYFDVRLGQAVELLGYLGNGGRPDPTRPLILAGDLNSPPEELPARLLRSGAGLQAVSGAGIDTILVRAGDDLALEVQGSRRVLGETVTYEDGSQGRLSDHDGVLAEIALGTSARRATLAGSGHDWPDIAAETLSTLEQAHRRLSWQTKFAALLAFGFGFAFVHGLRRARRQRGWRGHLWRGASLGALSLASWIGYFALILGPAEMVWIERAHDTVEALRRKASNALEELRPALLGAGRGGRGEAEARQRP